MYKNNKSYAFKTAVGIYLGRQQEVRKQRAVNIATSLRVSPIKPSD